MSQYNLAGHINANAVRLGGGSPAASPAEEDLPMSMTLGDLTALTVRLARVLAEEVDLLEQMKIKEIENLQEEKNRLTRSIAVMKKELERLPSLTEKFLPDEVEAFRKVAAVFGHVLEENRRKLMAAKEINLSMVRAIADVIREEAQRNGYNRKGINGTNRALSPSISLNKTI